MTDTDVIKAGPWTSHGHDIPGITVAGDDGRPPRARCGGVPLCGTCAREAAVHALRAEAKSWLPVPRTQEGTK